jgi:hypothetical protein
LRVDRLGKPAADAFLDRLEFGESRDRIRERVPVPDVAWLNN